MDIKNILINTNQQKVLDFLADHLGQSFFESEIVDKTKISSGGAHYALKVLFQADLVECEGRGRRSRYFVNTDNPLIRQWKVLSNIAELFPLIKKLKNISQKIILFGSAAHGTNLKDSDIDLFVLTNVPNEVRQIVQKHPLREKIQLITKEVSAFLNLKKKDPVFYRELSRGFILYERKE